MGELLPGTYLVRAMESLILDLLAQHPEGLTNTRVGLLTGLNPPISHQSGYVTWTILTYLVETGQVVKDGHCYRLSSH